MSLFRLAFLIGLVVMLMPSDKAKQEQLYEQAAQAAHWTATFCDRNGATCETASRVWAAFLEKAKFTGQLAYDIWQSRVSGNVTTPAPAMERFEDNHHSLERGTLTPQDMRPVWRGGTARQGA